LTSNLSYVPIAISSRNSNSSIGTLSLEKRQILAKIQYFWPIRQQIWPDRSNLQFKKREFAQNQLWNLVFLHTKIAGKMGEKCASGGFFWPKFVKNRIFWGRNRTKKHILAKKMYSFLKKTAADIRSAAGFWMVADTRLSVDFRLAGSASSWPRSFAPGRYQVGHLVAGIRLLVTSFRFAAADIRSVLAIWHRVAADVRSATCTSGGRRPLGTRRAPSRTSVCWWQASGHWGGWPLA